MKGAPRPAAVELPAPLLARARAVESAIRAGHGAASGWMAGRTAGLITLLLGSSLLAVYYRQLFHGGARYATLSVLLVATFVATLYVIELGVGVIVLAMLFSPEVSLGSLGSRDLAIRLEDLLIPLLVLAWLGRKALGMERRELRFDLVFVPMLLFVSVQVLATMAGWGIYHVNLTTAVFYVLKQVEYYAIFFFILQYIDSEKKTRAVITLAVLTAVFLALYNILLIPTTEVWTRHRLSAPFEGQSPEPSSLGGYFVLVLALLLAFLLEAPDRRTRAVLLLLFALIFVPMLYTLSRTSYVAFFVMLLVIAWLKRSRRLLLAIGAGIAAAPLLLPTAVIERVMFTFQDHIKVFGYFDRSFGERLYIWYKVMFRLRHNPLFGRGVTYEQVIDSYYARVLIETGIVGLVLFLLVCWRLFRLAREVRERHPQWWARAFALGYSAGLVALLIHAFSAITFVIVRIMEPFWLLSGIIAALACQLPPAASARASGVASAAGAPTAPPTLRRNLAHG